MFLFAVCMSLHEPCVRGLKRQWGSVTLKVVKVYWRGRSCTRISFSLHRGRGRGGGSEGHRNKTPLMQRSVSGNDMKSWIALREAVLFAFCFAPMWSNTFMIHRKTQKNIYPQITVLKLLWGFFFLLIKETEFNTDASLWHYRGSQRLPVKLFIIYFLICIIQKCWQGVGVSLKHPFFILSMAEISLWDFCKKKKIMRKRRSTTLSTGGAKMT